MPKETLTRAKLEKEVSEVLDAISSPEFVKTMIEFRTKSKRGREKFAKKEMTIDSIKAKGVKLPKHMRLSSRTFEEGITTKNTYVDFVKGRKIIKALKEKKPKLLKKLKKENPDVYQDLLKVQGFPKILPDTPLPIPDFPFPIDPRNFPKPPLDNPSLAGVWGCGCGGGLTFCAGGGGGS